MEEQNNKRPLDEVMLAMDVVDTLRHQEMLVKRELHAEDRDQKMIERLREIYASQGIDVPDYVLREGVSALKEERFVYKPPRRSISVILARMYISRGAWAKRIGIIVLAGAILWGSYQFFFVGADQRRMIKQTRELSVQREAVLSVAKVDEVKSQAQEQFDRAMAALKAGDFEAADASVDSLKTIRVKLEQQYEIRIVSRPGEYSGVWRIPEQNPSARNYYIIVEAVAPDGTILSLPITSEEDGRIRMVDKWALRVDEQLFQRVSADKQDDGIIQNRRVGIKKRGYLDPEYLMPTSGAAITDW